MRKLAYRPNRVARALVTGRSRTLGVVSFDTTLYGPGLDAARDRAAPPTTPATSSASRACARSTPTSIAAAPSSGCGEQGVDGHPRDRAAGVRGAGAAARAGGRADRGHRGRARTTTIPLVAVDQVAGARAATRHLLELGHRTVWHVSGPPDWLEAQDRVAAGARRSTPPAPRHPPLLVGDWSARSGYELGRAPGRRCASVTAVFVANDQMALGRPAAPARARPPDPRGDQRRRLRRHPRGGATSRRR